MKITTKKERNALLGKMLVMLQLITWIGFVVALLLNKMLPMKFLVIIAGMLLVIWGICFGMQFSKKKVRLAALVMSIIMSISQFAGVYFVTQANQMMDMIGGANYKIDNMVVVVKEDDAAQELLDTINYDYGLQYVMDQGNTKRMIEEVETILQTELSKMEYESLHEMGQALLNGEVQALIYNEAYTSVIEEMIEDYASKVRVIYQYGIETEIMKKEADVTNAFNVYISGIDVSGDISKNSRSDVNIIMTVNPDTKQILLTTTPRDFYVEIPGISGGAKDKLTHAGIYGVDASMRTLEDLYGIDISYYARVNFTSLIKIVDALGGIDVESEYAFSSRGYEFSKGMNHLNGEQALVFSRERKSFASGDRQRGKNQEAVIEAILHKAMSPAILVNATEIIARVSDCVETNMTRDEMTEFINNQLSDPAFWDIEAQAADGSGSSAFCYSSGRQQLYVMIPDESVVSGVSQKLQEVLTADQ